MRRLLRRENNLNLPSRLQHIQFGRLSTFLQSPAAQLFSPRHASLPHNPHDLSAHPRSLPAAVTHYPGRAKVCACSTQIAREGASVGPLVGLVGHEHIVSLQVTYVTSVRWTTHGVPRIWRRLA